MAAAANAPRSATLVSPARDVLVRARDSPGGLLLLTLTPVALLVLAAAVYTTARGYNPSDPLTDPSDTVGFGRRYGALVIVGLALWIAAATVAFAASASPSLSVQRRNWLSRFALATLLLWLDDAYLLHESLTALIPNGEPIVMAALGLLLAALLLPGARSVLKEHRFRLVPVVAVALLAGSVLFDVLEVPLSQGFGVPRRVPGYIEEVLKLLGIAAWFATALALSRPADAAGDPAARTDASA